MLFERESGILLHPTSLPGPHGIGEIGAEALRWLEELRAMGQGLWQVLPLGPTGFGDSPYQSPSSFAGAPQLLSLATLRDEGLLEDDELAPLRDLPRTRADFARAIPQRQALLRRAARRLAQSPAARAELASFRERQRDWLDDWALFDALKQAHEGRAWSEWPAPLRDRDGAALARARDQLGDEIAEATALQFLFDRQWRAVRARALALGIRIVGDLPIFVAHDSADVWQRRELFHLDGEGLPTVVAGVPPDYFSETGQRWGNPLYRWEAHAAEDYTWWAARLRRTLEMVDVVRIDHFRGFAAYWEIPASEPTAIHGRWLPGPGFALFDSLRRRLGSLPVIAEDLGLITPDVEALRDRLGFPGMRVLQFAFGGGARNPHAPGRYLANCVAYTGTHDNDTLAGWIAGGSDGDGRAAEQVARERARLERYLHLGRLGSGARRPVEGDLGWACIELLLRSRAGAVIVPLQDVLGLGSEARMNTPGRPEGNWAWRFTWEQLEPARCARLAALSRAAGRWPRR